MAIGEWKKKPWGQTRALHLSETLEVIECEIKAGGFSSHHLHKNKSNEFQVVSGRLTVFVDDCPGGRYVELTPGGKSTCVVRAGIRHGFEAKEPTVLIEHYFAEDGVKCDPEDIERFTAGGMRRGFAPPPPTDIDTQI